MKIAILLPCYQEEATIAETVRAFAHALPDAAIYVYDNNSTDNTVASARHASLQRKSETTEAVLREIVESVPVPL